MQKFVSGAAMAALMVIWAGPGSAEADTTHTARHHCAETGHCSSHAATHRARAAARTHVRYGHRQPAGRRLQAVSTPPPLIYAPPSRRTAQADDGHLNSEQLGQVVAGPPPLGAPDDQGCRQSEPSAAQADCSFAMGEVVVRPPPMRGFEAYAAQQQALIHGYGQAVSQDKAQWAMQFVKTDLAP